MVIQETVKEVKANQKQCKRLAERIDAITFALKSMDDRALCRLELRKSLDNYRTCIQKCLEFVTQFKDETSWFSKVFKNQNSKEKFEELNLQLTQYATDFNLSINLKQIFDPKLDENDQKTDLDAIQCKLDEIASLMAQRQDEQLRHVKGIEENISQRLNSFKHYLQQNIMKRSDSHRAKDIAEEDSAFLHIPYYDLVREQCIGQGGFADVYRGRWLSQDHEVAIKVIRVQHLNETNGKDFLVKVADFGLAKIRYETSCQSSISHSVGTLIWKAPELLRIERHTEASDVYALGVVLWELGTGCEPYAEADDSTISTFVLRGDRLNIPGTIPHSFAEMISRAWAHEPQNRPTCQQLLSSVKEIRVEKFKKPDSTPTSFTTMNISKVLYWL
ncbi:unnamed protein product [Rotaria sp. Silwood1]|nr:unnamed protein product [Rotaria sp. Silwood1]